jgi:AraC-like DNA-binding protein
MEQKDINKIYERSNYYFIKKCLIDKYSLNPLIGSVYITEIFYCENLRKIRDENNTDYKKNKIIYCTKGNGIINIEDVEKEFKENDVVIISKNINYILDSEYKSNFSIIIIYFQGYNSDYFMKYFTPGSFFGICDSEKLNKVKKLLYDIILKIKSGITTSKMIYISQVFSYIMALTFYDNDISKKDKKINSLIENSIGFMKNNIKEQLTLEKLANKANLSVSHYSSIFKQEIGISPIDYFIRLKIKRACLYLDSTELKINEIAIKVGFTDPYYFSRCFSKIMHTSPSEYRKINRIEKGMN